MRGAGTRRPRRRDAGFSLLELVVVLFLAGLLAALVAPSFEAPLESARLRAGAVELRATLLRARTLAAAGARERAVALDLEAGVFGIAGERRVRELPEGVRFEAVRIAGAETGRTATIRFYPDGSGEDAEVALASRAGGRLRVTVDPLTGVAEGGT